MFNFLPLIASASLIILMAPEIPYSVPVAPSFRFLCSFSFAAFHVSRSILSLLHAPRPLGFTDSLLTLFQNQSCNSSRKVMIDRVVTNGDYLSCISLCLLHIFIPATSRTDPRIQFRQGNCLRLRKTAYPLYRIIAPYQIRPVQVTHYRKQRSRLVKSYWR